MTPYLHQTPNRIRIRSSWIQRHPQDVTRLVDSLRARDGILDVVHRLYAGSVAVSFDPSRISASALLSELEQAQWLSSQKDKSYIENSLRVGAGHLLKTLAFGALKRTVGGPVVSIVSVLTR
ncbi:MULTISPECIES: hypothetical protein [Enterobacteriaceae]|uniref:Uncharacterized protein n=1 Tax=Kluyvera genomosp. 2 TaxID=2774054 RepID=A0A2T2Y6V5_9ENTR|nr:MULTISPECIES: hypothetical protein [Enterobacteriaceae]HAT3917570.1 allophanate hydrolase subunit 1 [Kluyvera ascorbata]PSR48260.1 hypothetical protein C8256_03725 [Kluyvera genomosp. 2]BBQ84848.1 hypothetical protein WP3W18E02_33770 [Klebsiella sp. WP3-W18-ESBL-02]BBR21900.1 hypothetical protein WP3S18E05_33800 [Klebsiella sp. WP3-S18-ESBL-05]BBR57992.1 hypothetical protein WP4W18E05_13600 [Klebsiella sp. WP4-W18-ESBL-05]